MVAKLLDEGVNPIVSEAGDGVALSVEVVEDILSRENHFVTLDEVGEGDSSLGTDHTQGDSVEAIGALVTSDLSRSHSHGDQSVVNALPRSRVRTNRTSLDLSGVNPEVLRVLTDEVDEDCIESGVVGPGDPVVRGRNEVTNPEATEECGVHFVDVVLSTVVDSRDDAGLRVEAIRITILVVTKLPVQDQLEG